MEETKQSYCNTCKKLIVFVRTKAGKMMPCEPNAIPYVEDERGNEQVLTREGRLVRCYIVRDRGECDGFGYVPHFARCISAAGRRRTTAYKEQGGCGVGGGTAAKKPNVEVKPKTDRREDVEKAPEQLCLFPSEWRHKMPI